MAFVSCLSLPPSLPLSLFSLSASRLSYSFSAGKVKCCLLPVRSEGAQGYSAPPPTPHPTLPPPPIPSLHLHLALWQQCSSLRAPLRCAAPAVAATVAGRAAEECVYPLQLAPSFQVPCSSMLICFQRAAQTAGAPRVSGGQQLGPVLSVYGQEK